MQETLIRPGLGVVQGRVNAGFIAGDGAAVVIDTMNSPADGRDIAAFVRRHTPAPVLAVVNTHHHADHTFGNQAFGVPVVASAACRAVMVANLAADWAPDRLQPMHQMHGERLAGLTITLPSVTFDRSLVLHLGSAAPGGSQVASDVAVEVQVTGGHAPGHSIVLIPAWGVAFGGDLFFVGRYPFVRQAHIQTWIAALERIKQLELELLVPGHGPLCEGSGIAAEIDRHIAYFHATCGLAADLLAAGLVREEIVARAADFPRFADDGYERLHAVNIGQIVDQLQAAARTDR